MLVTRAELQAAYSDLCQVLDRIASILESDDPDQKKLAAIEELVFVEEEGE